MSRESWKNNYKLAAELIARCHNNLNNHEGDQTRLMVTREELELFMEEFSDLNDLVNIEQPD